MENKSNGTVPAAFLAQHVLASSTSSQFLTSISTLNEDLVNFALSEELMRPDAPGGSAPGRSANLQRDSEAGHQLLIQDYFAESPVYPDKLFRRRFRMSRNLFLHIMQKLGEKDPYFTQRYDALGEFCFVDHSFLLFRC